MKDILIGVCLGLFIRYFEVILFLINKAFDKQKD